MRTSTCLLLFASFAAAVAIAATDHDNDALARARHLQYEFRLGNLQVADSLVEGLEAAVARSPDNADLWEALGNAYMSKQGALSASTWDPPALIAAGDRAREAFARALSMDDKNALLLASHGMAGAATALFKQDSATLMSSIDEMNAAVRQAPNSTPVRLTRGFTIIHLPPAIRDTAAVTEDLNFVLNTAPGGRPEDVLHVLLGDVHAEVGNVDAARAEYARVTGASRFAADEVKSRLRDLEKGTISKDSITRVRAGTGNQCVMCHAPGSDN